MPQDGDNSVKTTLASCPSLCDGNPRGRRDATLQFAVDKLPANASKVKAKLRVLRLARLRRPDPRAVRVPGDLSAAASPAELAAVSERAGDRQGVARATTSSTCPAAVQRQRDVHVRAVPGDLQHAGSTGRPGRTAEVRPAARTRAHLRVGRSRRRRPPCRRRATTSTTAPGAEADRRPRPSRPPPRRPRRSPPTTTDRPPPPRRTAGGWSGHDEFNGGAHRPVEVERPQRRGPRHRPRLQRQQPEELVRRRRQPDHPGAAGDRAACSSQTRQYTQAYLDTIGKHSWTYGRFEMRAKSPNEPDHLEGPVAGVLAAARTTAATARST